MNSDINSKISRLQSVQSLLNNLSKKIDSINLDDYWTGQGSEMFINNIKKLRKDFISLDDRIDETIANLRKCKRYDEVSKNE